MASNKVMVITKNDIKNNFTLTEAEFDALKFLTEHAGMEMNEEQQNQFISSRNAKIGAITRLWEFKAWCKKAVDFIEVLGKHAFNVGTIGQFPKNVSLKNNGSTHKFKDGSAQIVADTLMKKHLVTKEQLFAVLSVDNIVKASGLTKEKLMEMFPDVIIEEKKAASLIIK